MRIYRERIPAVAREVVKALMRDEQIEVEREMVDEVELDVASVLTEYRRRDYELTEKAKDLVTQRGLDYSQTHKIKGKLASDAKFGIGDDAIEWIANQIIEILIQSRNVEEVWGEDHDLRRLVGPILKKELGLDEGLGEEVAKRMKHLEQGTEDYEIEFKKTLASVRRAKGLND